MLSHEKLDALMKTGEMRHLLAGVRTNTRIQRLRDRFVKEKNDILQQAS
jgi:hypothetical protein